MIVKHMDSIRRALAIAAFVVALILLTGTPAMVREIAIEEDTPLSEEEIRAMRPNVVQLPEPGESGPLSVEWEDPGMDREHGAWESCAYVRDVDFAPSELAFDAAFASDEDDLISPQEYVERR